MGLEYIVFLQNMILKITWVKPFKGWMLPKEHKNFKYWIISPYRTYSLLYPTGFIHEFKDIEEFHKKYNLKIRGIRDLIFGRVILHCGWRLFNKRKIPNKTIKENF